MSLFKYIVTFLILVCAFTSQVCASYIDMRGFWVGNDVQSNHCFDKPLAEALAEWFSNVQAESIVDFGCGMGDYVKFFRNSGLNADGYDGNPFTPSLTEGLCGVLDLSNRSDLGRTYDWVLSLEVGEHLPPEYETIYIENLIRHCEKGVVLSWAVKNQGGHGHVNEQDNAYIKKIFASYGFTNSIEAEKVLREKSTFPWFKNTVMIFFKTK